MPERYQQPGRIGGSLLFNGGNPLNAMDAPGFYYVCPQWATPRTVSAWVNKADNTVGVVFGYGTLSFYVDNQELHFWDGGIYNSPTSFDTGVSLPLNTWNYVVMSYDGSSSISAYVNGALVKQVSGNLGQGYGDVVWGVDMTGTHGFPNAGWYKGLMDETRISSTLRPADWILAEYRNQNSPATFYALGAESGGGPVITSLSPGSGPAGALVTITGSNFGAVQGSSTVTFNGTSAGFASGWSAGSIRVTVPNGAATGNVVVTVNGVASGGRPFTVTLPPAISGVSPTTGTAGTQVTISGSGFGAARGTGAVWLGSTYGTVVS